MIGKGHPLPDAKRERIRKLRREGLRVTEIAESCGVSRRTVYRAIDSAVPKSGTGAKNSGNPV